jgi:hypothetical protein
MPLSRIQGRANLNWALEATFANYNFSQSSSALHKTKIWVRLEKKYHMWMWCFQEYYVHMHTPHNTMERTHAKILVSTLEHQVSWGDTS